MLRQAKEEGQRLFGELVQRAVARLEPSKLRTTRKLFTGAETAELANLLHTIHTTAELLGRASLHQRARQLEFTDRQSVGKFSDLPTDFTAFDDTIPLPPSPEAALSYFRKLIPTLREDAPRPKPKNVFTMYAIDADKALLSRVKSVILQALEGKESKPETVISDLLQDKQGQLRTSVDAYAEMATRTNMMGAYTTGISEEMKEPSVAEVFTHWKYLGIRDGRQGEDHEPHFDKIFPNSVSFESVRGARPWNCLLPENKVSGRFTAGLKAIYAGEAIELHAAGGSRLSVTPNHPILTPRGFIAAGQLVEGDNLVCDGGECQVPVFGKDEQDAPAIIEDVFDAFEVLFGGARMAPVSLFNLHGDAKSTQGQIEVVRTNWRLVVNHDALFSDSTAKGFFSPRLQVGSMMPRLRALGLNLKAILLAASRLLGLGNLPLPLFALHSGPFESLGFAPGSWFDSSLQETIANSRPIYTKRLRQGVLRLASLIAGSNFRGPYWANGTGSIRLGAGARFDARLTQPAGNSIAFDLQFIAELLGRFASEVSLDEVVEVRRFHYSGPVFDMETTQGYYTAAMEGKRIFVSNCRCCPIPLDYAEIRSLRKQGWNIP